MSSTSKPYVRVRSSITTNAAGLTFGGRDGYSQRIIDGNAKPYGNTPSSPNFASARESVAIFSEPTGVLFAGSMLVVGLCMLLYKRAQRVIGGHSSPLMNHGSMAMAAATSTEGAPPARRMKALVQHGYGGIDAYGLDEVPIPRAGPGEVVVRVHYAALNPIDFKRREGYVASATGPEPFPVVPGYDVAGVVHELGEGVTALALGDAVYGLAHAGGLAVQKHGTFAQYTKFAAEAFARQPEGLGAAACAALPVSLLTTHQALAAMGVTGPGSGRGKSILVTGGAGGVGHLALQLLRHHFGFAEVAATCSAAKADCCRAFGATAVVDYNDTTYPAAYEKRFDFLYDTAGDAAVSKVVVKDGGQLCSIAAFGVEGVPVHVLRGSPDLARYETLLQNRVVVPKVEVFELENYKAAFARLEGGRVVGKIVLRMPQ